MGNSSLISFIARSKRRLEILSLLKEHELSQVKLTKLTKMYKGHTSRTLKELCDKKLIVCRNPEDRSFRFYRITPLGRKILEESQKLINT